jgi:hypothetical protein
MGSGGPRASQQWGRVRLGRAFGLGPDRIGWVLFIFFEIIFQCKTNSGKTQKMFKGTKNTQKTPKNPGKFPEIDWDMNNPNKVFGAHEKDFRAF